MVQAGEQGFVPVTLILRSRADAAGLHAIDRSVPRAERRAKLVTDLRAHMDNEAAALLAFLDEQQLAGHAQGRIRTLWISNAVALSASPQLIRQLAQRGDIAHINFDRPLGKEVLLGGFGSGSTPTCGLVTIGAPQVWQNLGVTGQGVVVGVIDTGTCMTHPDLAGQIWTNPGEQLDGTDRDGNGYIDDLHGWNFQSDNNNISDTDSHGTHVAGSVLGDGTNGDRTGVAPNARLMTLKFWNNFSGESTVWEAMQYGVANGADILTASLGWPGWSNPDKVTWRNTCENAIAAGVVVIYAAGNEGNCCPPFGSVRTPGDVPDVITVGATTCGDALADFSSIGPVSWQDVFPFNDWPYPPGKMKPTISAPGVDVLSTSNNCVSYSVKSGTSMAAPHVAGLAALILEANPSLDHFGVQMLLEATAVDLGAPGHDNSYGAGRVNALAAVEAALDLLTPADLNNDGIVDLGDLLILLAAWGPCPTEPCAGDLNGDEEVDLADLLILLAAWG